VLRWQRTIARHATRFGHRSRGALTGMVLALASVSAWDGLGGPQDFSGSSPAVGIGSGEGERLVGRISSGNHKSLTNLPRNASTRLASSGFHSPCHAPLAALVAALRRLEPVLQSAQVGLR
jgi:hypothetical protein